MIKCHFFVTKHNFSFLFYHMKIRWLLQLTVCELYELSTQNIIFISSKSNKRKQFYKTTHTNPLDSILNDIYHLKQQFYSHICDTLIQTLTLIAGLFFCCVYDFDISTASEKKFFLTFILKFIKIWNLNLLRSDW